MDTSTIKQTPISNQLAKITRNISELEESREDFKKRYETLNQLLLWTMLIANGSFGPECVSFIQPYFQEAYNQGYLGFLAPCQIEFLQKLGVELSEN